MRWKMDPKLTTVKHIEKAGGALPPAELSTARPAKREFDQAVMLVKALLLRGRLCTHTLTNDPHAAMRYMTEGCR